MSEEGAPARPAPKKRGPKPKPPGTLAADSRVNVTLDRAAQEALSAVQVRLAEHLGFAPTLTQTVLWLARRADQIKDKT